MSDSTIVALYSALDRRDGEAAAACYTERATFEDPAFGQLGPGEVQKMWRVLCGRSEDLRVELTGHGAQDAEGWATWTARYSFGGRPVVNRVTSRMRFEDGLIADQHDEFDLRKWGGQAMGAPARLLGAVGLLKPVVQRRARAGLKG